jgi:two-component system chemotaxis response regulator CheV
MARKMITGILEKAGVVVHAVENGEQARQYMNQCRRKAQEKNLPLQHYVDVIVSDIEMPVMDGHTLTRSLKEDPDFRPIPVVLCSSIITETLHHKGIAVGADEQVSKAELGDLVPKIYALLGQAVRA